jgi:hypothetical protein
MVEDLNTSHAPAETAALVFTSIPPSIAAPREIS